MSKTTPPTKPAPAENTPDTQAQPAVQEAPNPSSGGCYVRDPITGALSPDPTTTTSQE
jgi:hypothetical protein